MIHKNWGDDGALTLIRVVLERTEDQELREQLLEFLQNNEELWSDAHVKDFYGFATTLANDGTTVKLSDEEAENLLTLWKEAQDTILKDVEEEDYWEKFDPWLKEKAPNLHEKIMDAYYQETSERLSIGGWVESDEFMSIGHDIDGAYLDYDNEVVINQIFPPSE